MAPGTRPLMSQDRQSQERTPTARMSSSCYSWGTSADPSRTFRNAVIASLRSQLMKQLLLLVLLLIFSGQTLAQANEADELREFIRQYQETWQSHDAERLGDFFAEDSDMIVGIQPRIVGREAIAAWWNHYFSRIDRGRLLSVSIDSIRLLSPDIALINVATTTGGTHSETNEILESRKARGTWVVTRGDGGWKISALRAHSPIGQLRQAPGTDKPAQGTGRASSG